MRKIKRILSSNKFQRFFYCILLSFDIYLFFRDNTIKYIWSISSFGISYFFLYSISTIVLLYQIIFNNFLGWLTFLAIYLLITIYGVITGFLDIIADYGTKYTEIEIILVIIVDIIIFLPLGLLIFLINPKKKQK
jgi:hypothetical protein